MPDATAAPRATDELRTLIAPYRHAMGGPVAALRTLQVQRGWIDPEAVEAVADVFNLGRAEVRGLVQFYADFRTEPPAEHVLAVCQAEACQAAGSRELTKTLSDRLGIGLGERTADGRFGLEAVYCLGLCARAPAMMADGELVVDAGAAAEQVLEELGS